MPKRWRRRVGHVPEGTKYAVQNSNWFVRYLKRHGIRWVDRDGLVTKDNVPVCGHWGLIAKNGFFLPRWFKKKYGKNPRVKNVNYSDLAKVKTPYIWFHGKRRYRVHTLWQAITLSVLIDEGLMYEQKGAALFRQQSFWESVGFHMKTSGLPNSRLVVATLPNMKGAFEVLKAAHSAGRETMVIRAQDGVPRSWAPYMTWYRGKIKWI